MRFQRETFQGFVLTVTLCREAFDDFCRYLRDKEMNDQKYEVLSAGYGRVMVTSADIKVGDIVLVHKVPRNF